VKGHRQIRVIASWSARQGHVTAATNPKRSEVVGADRIKEAPASPAQLAVLAPVGQRRAANLGDGLWSNDRRANLIEYPTGGTG
jgi:hypothetical protein